MSLKIHQLISISFLLLSCSANIQPDVKVDARSKHLSDDVTEETNGGELAKKTPNQEKKDECASKADCTNTSEYVPPSLVISKTVEVALNASIHEILSDSDVDASKELDGKYSLDLISVTSPGCHDHATELEIDSTKGTVSFAPANNYFGTCHIKIIFDDELNQEKSQVASEVSVKVNTPSHFLNDFENSGSHLETEFSANKLQLKSIAPIPSLDSSWIDLTNLVAYWKFDGEGAVDLSAGSISDSKSTYHGTAFDGGDGSLWHAPARVGQGISLDGVDDTIRIADNAAIRAQWPMSVSAWVYVDQLASEKVISFKRGGTNDGWGWSVQSTGKLRFTFFGVDDVESSAVISEGGWHHLAVSVSGTGFVKFYVNGVYEGNDNFGSFSATSSDLMVGTTTDGSGTIIGYDSLIIDEFSFWNIEQTAENFKKIYARQNHKYRRNVFDLAKVPVDKTDLVAYYPFDGALGEVTHLTSIPDMNPLAPNTHDGVLSDASSNDSSFFLNGMIGQSIKFYRAEDYISVPHSNALNSGDGSWSVSLWANPKNADQLAAIINKRVSASPWTQWSMTIAGDIGGSTSGQQLGVFLIEHSSTSKRIALTDDDVVDGNWHHYVLVADKNLDQINIYVDGAKQAVTRDDTGAWPNVVNSDDILIGKIAEGSHFGRSIDELSIWKKSLSDDDIKLIYQYQKEKFAGYYTSQIMDAYESKGWDTLRWESSAPFSKELPKSKGQEAVYDESNAGSFMAGNTLLLDFNEAAAPFVDSSGSGNNPSCTNCPTPVKGQFNNAVLFDGIDDYLSLPVALTNGITEFAASLWIKTNDLGTCTDLWECPTLLGAEVNTAGSDDFGVMIKKGFLSMWEGVGGISDDSTVSSFFIADGQWHHVVVSNDGANFMLYADGMLVQSSPSLGDALAAVPFYLGSMNDDSTPAGFLSGVIDEFAFFGSSLTSSEVKQLYLRGASKVAFEARTCADATCSSNPPFLGYSSAGAEIGEFYNEALNSTVGLPVLDMSDQFGTAQYFQVRAILTSQDLANATVSAPDVKSFRLDMKPTE